MRTKLEFKRDIAAADERYAMFEQQANWGGGMHAEARIKLLELNVQDLMQLVSQLVDNIPECE